MVQNLTRDEVKQKIDAGKVTVLEALPESYYKEAHLPGARNLPLDEVDALAPELVPDKQTEVIVYCTGVTCPNSGIAANRLAELGYERVYTYEAGKEDWTGAGLPTESD
ncbi:rhodanese-like domain-containing protein [Streptomyces coeruleorubidus]|uniref:rhodanese-like domain-containing protein n=1 Tax=Streptomyces coeruleorubidus TaxID=116188 RepID=UPI00237F6059|nr:rhodanese-like domain-containing protein [Streptomyces coeruleorubidus]WDV51183.1 rhodanese-like domain-containing protein [Streptomyces coeruleorubidus]